MRFSSEEVAEYWQVHRRHTGMGNVLGWGAATAPRGKGTGTTGAAGYAAMYTYSIAA